MAKYIYRARICRESRSAGHMKESQDAVLTALKSRGLIVTQIQEAPQSAFSSLSRPVSRKPVKAKILAI